MKILGINHSNDSAAALVLDGQVVAACAEERFSRIKHDTSFPHKSINWILKTHGLALEDIDQIAFFWNPLRHMDAPHRRLINSPRHHLEYLYSLPNHLLYSSDTQSLPHIELKLPWQRGPRSIYFVTHHLCHAAHAYFDSPYNESAILTVDGYGERASTTIAKAEGSSIDVIKEINFPRSIGSVYAAITQYLGFSPNGGEGKVMGLSSYGKPKYIDLFRELLRTTDDGFDIALPYFDYYMDRAHRYSQKLIDALGPARTPESKLLTEHFDIAASLQAATEEALIHLSKQARRFTQSKNLCMAGGVTLNCVANGKIASEAGFDDIFFQPACSDAGTSAGAALYVAHLINGEKRGDLNRVKTDYLGPEFSANHIKEALEFANLSYQSPSDLASDAAASLAAGKIIGRFSGRAEFGPRALGNRSILSAPGPEKMKDTLNARVKLRESFRPFAPSVCEESCGTYFDRDTPSPFMLRAYNTKAEYKEALGAITHVDGTARVQTVNPAQNKSYHALIKAHGDQRGIECILNTSFNIRGEPIVNTPQDALRCFYSTGMDVLYLGPYKVEK